MRYKKAQFDACTINLTFFRRRIQIIEYTMMSNVVYWTVDVCLAHSSGGYRRNEILLIEAAYEIGGSFILLY